jgi:hypothetical protein
MTSIAPHIYGIRELSPVDKKWITAGNDTVERTYYYNPWDTSIFYGDKWGNIPNSNTGIYPPSYTTTYPRQYSYVKTGKWACTASLVNDGEEVFSFVSRGGGSEDSASVTGELLDYNNISTGTFRAYFEMVKTSTPPNESKDPVISTGPKPTILRSGAAGYTNGVATDVNGMRFDFIKTIYGVFTCEEIPACLLKFTVERNYTAIDRSAYYVVRAVNDMGEEGQVSEISELVTRKPDEKSVVTFTPSKTAGIEHITKYRLYRSAGGTSGSDFFFVDEISAGGDLVFNDIKSDAELNEKLPVYGEVPTGISGIASMSGGFIAAYKGKDIYFSEPYKPYIFPYEYNQSVPFDIVGLAVKGNYLYVMTEGALTAFVGDTPANILPLSMNFNVPCISKKSIAHIRGDIIYAGTTGLVIISNNGPSVFSDKLYTLEQYKNLHFENCLAAGEYDGKYFAVFEDKVLLFDFADGDLKHTTLEKTAFNFSKYQWNDGSWKNYEQNFKQSNTPYGETMITQDFADENLQGKWQSKQFVFPRPIAFTSARIFCDDPEADVYIKLYANENNLVYSGKAVCNRAFRLPVMRRENKWSVEVSSANDINSVELAESMTEM